MTGRQSHNKIPPMQELEPVGEPVFIDPDDPKGRARLTKMFEVGQRRRFRGRTVRGRIFPRRDSHVGKEPESRRGRFAGSYWQSGWTLDIDEPDDFENMDYDGRGDKVDPDILCMTPGSMVSIPPSGLLILNSALDMPLSVTSVFDNTR